MEEEQKPEEEQTPVEEQPTPAEEAPVEEPQEEPTPVEETPEEAPVEEAPAEEPAAPVEESGEDKEGCCSEEGTKSAEDSIRDVVNLINVYKEEEKEGVTTRIDPATADELVAKLEELAKKVGGICQ